MDGSVSAEDQDGVGLVVGVEFVAGENIDARQLELPDVMLFRDGSQQSDGAHRATVAYRKRKAKSDSPGVGEQS
jgi:hypothetical protein